MQKPISVAKREYIDAIVKTTNASGLPFAIIVDVMEGILREARQLAEQEYQRDLAAWTAAQKKGADDADT